MNIPNGTWVVVADGGKFLVLENEGDAELINLQVLRRGEQDNPPSREQAANRPGRLNDVGRAMPGDVAGVGRSAVQDTDWHEIAKERFADELADKLRRWALEKRFAKLVLAADPSTLGEVRGKLHGEVKATLLCELNKDLTNHPVEDIEAALAKA